MKVQATVNGESVQLVGHPLDRLLDVLREQCGLTGTKEGCGEGECGACTVLIDDEPVLSCLIPILQCHGKSIRTVEDVAADPSMLPVLERFIAEGGSQCGACTPGIVVTAHGLLRRSPAPSRKEVVDALGGNLCRCTGYEAIVRALVGE